MNDNTAKLIQAVWIICVIRRVEKTQLKWEYNAARELNICLDMFVPFESLEMQRKYGRWVQDLHALLRLLQT